MQQIVNTIQNKRSHDEGSSLCQLETTIVPAKQVENTVSRSTVDTPTYEQIFCVPKKKDRDPTKLYGREVLMKHFPEQHANFLSNHRKVNKWFKDVTRDESTQDLRHKPAEKEKIMTIIRQNIEEITPLNFPGASYTWKAEDIYSWVLISLQSRRKYEKNKNKVSDIIEVASSTVAQVSTGTMLFKFSSKVLPFRILYETFAILANTPKR